MNEKQATLDNKISIEQASVSVVDNGVDCGVDFWHANGFTLTWTADGSPSMQTQQSSETMHHRGGAYSETQLIYGETLRNTIKHQQAMHSKQKINVLSVGLGLGYNEILTACEMLKNNISPDQVFLCSFESEPFLRKAIIDWYMSAPLNSDYVDAVKLYDRIAGLFAADQVFSSKSISVDKIKQWLRQAIQNNHWQILSAIQSDWPVGFDKQQLEQMKFHCVFYDAFSSKTSPHLWQEDFLEKFLTTVAAPCCHFSTYACTGALKRVLKKINFQVSLPPGFNGKRQRTSAVRLID